MSLKSASGKAPSGKGTSVRSPDRTEGCPWVVAINRKLRLAMTSNDEIWTITEFVDLWGNAVDEADAEFAIVKQSENAWWCIILSQFVQEVN